KGYLQQGFAGGAWTGNGLTSSAAAGAGSAHKTALGYAEASSIGVSTFDGQSVDSTTLLVRYVFSGDANLDSFVNALDFNALASNFGGGGRFWVQGDFNYDGFTNMLDFNAIAANFNLALPTMVSEVTTPVGALVPEPASIAMT